jgi:predicted RNA binding protein YcfA (HicA-like mRNA interferase family)
VKVRDLIRLLEDDGWALARTRGSHKQFKHPNKSGTVTVAGKAGVDVPPSTLSAVLTGWPEEVRNTGCVTWW